MDKQFTLDGAVAEELERMDRIIDSFEKLLDPTSIGYSVQLGMYYKMINSRNAFMEKYGK